MSLPRLLRTVVGILAALVVGEMVLRIVGFRYETFPTVQFGWPTPEIISTEYKTDRDLFWVPLDYEDVLARARLSPPAVVFVGDSCTQFGTYPRLTLQALAPRHPELARGVKLGVAGWSSEQGLAQMRRDVVPLRPRIVTIYFGWNDHWVALGPPDELARPGPVRFWLSRHVRLAQLFIKGRRDQGARALAERPNRVSLERYRANLVQMVREIACAGGHAILITAPSNHVSGHEPEYLAERHVRTLQELVPLHQAYVQETRAAAAEAGAELCDAAAAFAGFPPPMDSYFMQDGIHLSDEGNRRMAQLVTACILRVASR